MRKSVLGGRLGDIVSKYLDTYFCTFFLSHPQQYQWETSAKTCENFCPGTYVIYSSRFYASRVERKVDTYSLQPDDAADRATPETQTLYAHADTLWPLCEAAGYSRMGSIMYTPGGCAHG